MSTLPIEQKRTAANRLSSKSRRRYITAVTDNGYRLLILAVIIALWQIAVNLGWVNAFLMGSPAGIWKEAVRLTASGQLFTDTVTTLYATVVGFLFGSLLGSLAGLLMWYSKTVARILDPFIVALNGLPKIALAPMIIIWFGSGIFSKIALAFIATFIVALLSAYQGTHQIDSNLINLMRSLGASRAQIFRKVVIPATLPWIISAFRLNIGFALIADVGGEFISSDHGLGRMIFVAGNLFNLNAVWVGVLTLMIVAVCLYIIVSKLEARLLPWASQHNDK